MVTAGSWEPRQTPSPAYWLRASVSPGAAAAQARLSLSRLPQGPWQAAAGPSCDQPRAWGEGTARARMPGLRPQHWGVWGPQRLGSLPACGRGLGCRAYTSGVSHLHPILLPSPHPEGETTQVFGLPAFPQTHQPPCCSQSWGRTQASGSPDPSTPFYPRVPILLPGGLPVGLPAPLSITQEGCKDALIQDTWV